MSSQIDQRIVEMSFENHKFEKGIEQSKGSLQKFADMLKNMGTNKEFTGLEKSIEATTTSFSMLEQIGIGALRRIGEAAINAGSQLFKNLAIDPLAVGWTKYEQKTASVQTIMNATGKSIDEVNGYLDQLMWYSDETSYGFTDMTAALGQMTSSGGDIENIIPLITGVANATAYAGKGAGEFSRAMYNLNQSYGAGNLQFMDWRSLELAGVAGKELKSVFIQTAMELGTLNKNGKTAKGTLVTLGNFGSTLQEKWANTKVMEAAFGKFSELSQEAYRLVNNGTYDTAAEAMDALAGKYSKIAEEGFKSAQQAKSFSEAISATLDAVSSGWMRTYEIIFGQLPEATANFSALAEVLWTIFASGAEGSNAMLQIIKDAGGVAKVFQSIKNIGIALLKPLRAISQAFDQFFPPKTADQWMNILTLLESVTSKLIISEETADKIRRTFAGFFAIVDLGWQGVKFLASALYKLFGAFIPLNGSILDVTASIGDFLVVLNHVVKQSGVFQYAMLGIKVVAILVHNIMTSVAKSVGTFLHTLMTTEKPLEFLAQTVKKIFGGVFDALKTGIVWVSGKFMKALGVVQNFFDSKFNMGGESTITKIITSITDFIKFLMGGAADTVSEFAKSLVNIDFNKIATFVTGGILLLFVNQLSHLTKVMSGLVETTDSFVGTFNKKLFAPVTKMKDMAFTVAVLAGSLLVLSRIPWEQLKTGLIGLAGAMLIFVGAYAAIQAITVAASKNMNGAETMKSAFSLASLAGGLLIMALAIDRVSKIDEKKVWNSVGVVAGMMGLLAAYQALSVAISLIPGTRSANVKITGMANSVFALIGALLVLDFISTKSLSEGLVKLFAIMSVVAGLQMLFGVAAKLSNGHKLAQNLMGLSVGLLALVGVLKILTWISSREISEGVGNLFLLGGLLSAMQLMFALSARLSGGEKAKLNILSMAMGLTALTAIAVVLGKVDQTNLQNGIRNLAKMTGVIVAIEIFTAIAARIGMGHKIQRILGSVALTITSFTLIIGLLNWYTQAQIDLGLLTIAKMSGIIVGLQTLMALVSRIGGTGGIGSFVGLTTLIMAITGSLALLSIIDQPSLRKAATSLSIAVVAIGVMAVGLGVMIKSMSLMSNNLSNLNIFQKILRGFLALTVVLTATVGFLQLVKMITPIIQNIDWSALAKFSIGLGIIGSLSLAFGYLSKMPGLGSGASTLISLAAGLGGMAIAVVATAAMFALIGVALNDIKNVSFGDLAKFIAGVSFIGALVVGIAMLAIPLAALGSAALPALTGVLVAIAAVGLLIGAFVGMAAGMQALFASNPDFLIGGIDKMVQIAEGIGRFFGAMVGGFNAESSKLYGEGLAAFAEAVKDINPGAFTGVESLANAMMTLTSASLLDGIRRLVGFKSPGKAFGEQIKGLTQALSKISIADAQYTTQVLAALAPMCTNLKAVADAAKDIPNSGGLLGAFMGENDADKFGKQLIGFIGALAQVTTGGVMHADAILAAMKPMLPNLKSVAETAKTIPNSKGFLGDFMGNNDIDDFGGKLVGFLKAFNEVTVGLVINASSILGAMTPMLGNLKLFSVAASNIPNSDGWVSIWGGDNDIQVFGKKIASLVRAFSNIGAKDIVEAHDNMAAMSRGLLPGLERFIVMFNSLSATGGLDQAFSGESSFTHLAKEIKSFVKELKGVDVSVVAPALASLEQINGAFKLVGQDVVTSAISSVNQNKQFFQLAVVSMLDDTINLINGRRSAIATSFTSLFDRALTDTRKYISKFKTLGGDLVRGLQNGITANQYIATNSVKAMATSVISATGKSFQINSPSKVFSDLGRWIPAGLGSGITRNARIAILAGVNMADNVGEATRSALGVNSPSTLFAAIGKWLGPGLSAGIESTKSAVLKTAEKLGLDTGDVTIKGITDSIKNGEGAVTFGIKSVLDLLTGKTSMAELAGKVGGGKPAGFGAPTGSGVKTGTGTGKKETRDAFEIFKEGIDRKRAYNLMSTLEEINAWEAFTKKYKAGTEIRLKADKQLGELRYAYSTTWIDKEKYYQRMSLEKELSAWERVQSRYQKGHEYRIQAEKEIFRLKKEIWQADLQHSLDWVDDQKYYGKLNLTDELAAQKRIRAKTAYNSDEYKKASREIFRLESEIKDANIAFEQEIKDVEKERNDARTKATEDYYAKEKDINNKQKQDIAALTDAYDDAVDSRAKSLYATYGLFDKVEKPKYVSGFEMINNLEDQNTAFDKWQSSIGALAAKGIDDGLVKELTEMGPKALAQINALNRLSDSELTRYVDLWRKKGQEVKDQATSEMSGLAAQNVIDIQKINDATKVELDANKKVWNDTLVAINTENLVQLELIESNWKKSTGAMTSNGMELITKFKQDWSGEITKIVDETKTKMSELQNLTTNFAPVLKTLSTAMSASLNVGADGKEIVNGIASGIKNNMGVAGDAVMSLSDYMNQSMNGYWMIQSPSRKTMETGKFIVMGLANGLKQSAGLVATEGTNVGKTALAALSSSLSTIPDLLATDIDAFTIKPVLDLTAVQSGMYDVNSILGSASGLDMSSTMRLLPQGTPANQNGILSEIRNGLLSMTNPEVDLNGKLTVEVVNDKGEIVGIAETAIKDLLRRESR